MERVRRDGTLVRLTLTETTARDLLKWMGAASQMKLEQSGVSKNRVKHFKALHSELWDAMKTTTPNGGEAER